MRILEKLEVGMVKDQKETDLISFPFYREQKIISYKAKK